MLDPKGSWVLFNTLLEEQLCTELSALFRHRLYQLYLLRSVSVSTSREEDPSITGEKISWNAGLRRPRDADGSCVDLSAMSSAQRPVQQRSPGSSLGPLVPAPGAPYPPASLASDLDLSTRPEQNPRQLRSRSPCLSNEEPTSIVQKAPDVPSTRYVLVLGAYSSPHSKGSGRP
ncbi:hypothetical protein VTN00DRAFT_6734 [Thermoascus crustaceus]|uniref:uncharacterized protein n=1 Tax=Thermoascus crustaceus TaxID=5088 RepID=UPI003742498E